MREKTTSQPHISTRWHGRIPITLALVFSMGLLILVTVGLVLGIGVWTARKNTFNLLAQIADQSVTSQSDKVKAYLKPAESQARFIADLISRDKITPENQPVFANILTAALAAAPQIEALLFIKTDLKSIGAGREKEKIGVRVFNYSNDPYIVKVMKDVAGKSGWGPPIWREKNNKAYLNYAYPVIVSQKLIGAMVSIVSTKEISQFVSQNDVLGRGQSFLLYGRDHVLAHSSLIDGYAGGSAEHPIPHLPQFADKVLASIWQTQQRSPLAIPLPPQTSGHIVEALGEQNVFIYQSLKGYGPKPIIAGVYYRGSDVNTEIKRLMFSMMAGLLALVVSLIFIVFIGRRIARPIVRFSSMANRIQNLEVEKVGFLPHSIFRELDDQSKSFNAMLRALHWFELYVPKKIVESLIKQNIQVGDDISRTQEITVMFTDIVGFSSASENMTAREVASYVNQHFTLLAECIEAEDGIVDKFIGDSVMAFWGAPDTQTDSAERACRAALAIRQKIHQDNAMRQSNDKPPVHIRIGIHTGPAIAGNIGSPGRLNYTIIGDTVNTGQRLEQLGKEVYPADTEVSILVSQKTIQMLGQEFPFDSAGEHRLKGHKQAIEIFKLL